MMAARYPQSPDDASQKKQYQRLLNELRAMIEATPAVTLDLSQREHLLSCSDCGAFEDLTEAEDLVVYDEGEEPLPYPEFLIIDGKQRVFEQKKPIQHLTTYTFICPACGMYQTTIIREKFDEQIEVE
jgi:hypothetical protein